MGFFRVMKAELVCAFVVMRRYWFRTVTGLIISYGVLAMLIAAFVQRDKALDPALIERFATGEKATNAALGFIVGLFAFGVVGMFSQGLQALAQSGQLEQLCMSPHGLVTNFLARSVVAGVSSVLTSALLIWMVAMTFGGKLHADLAPTITLLSLTFMDLIGFGFMVGGLVLVFKQVGQVVVIVRMGLFALAVYATEAVDQLPFLLRWFAHALPITDAAICIKYVLIQGQMVDGEFRSVFLHPSFPLLVLNCVVWTTIGTACFKVMENWSRSKGTLGAY